MKITQLSIIILILISSNAICIPKNHNNDTLNGTYSADDFLIINISGDTLLINSWDVDLNPLAVCVCNKKGNSFLEINSISLPIISALKDWSIKYSKQPAETKVNHAIIEFILPNAVGELDIEVFCGNQNYKSICKDGKCIVDLDRNVDFATNAFHFSIAPKDYSASNFVGQYFGVLYLFYPFDIEFETDDIIIIDIPSITKYFFEKYFIEGEYIHIIDKGLEWRGNIFYKQK